MHSLFDIRTVDYDFALIELNAKLNYSLKIQPIAMPSVADSITDGTMCLTSGYGKTKVYVSYALRGVELPIVNQAKCTDANSGVNKVTDRMICAGYDEGRKGSQYILK